MKLLDLKLSLLYASKFLWLRDRLQILFQILSEFKRINSFMTEVSTM